MADYIRPTPRNPILGLLADALTGGVEWMRDPRRAQQMQGLGGLLAETGIPATVERMSYGEPLTTGRGMTTRLRQEAEAALMTLAPEAVPIGRAAMAGVRATKGLPVGASVRQINLSEELFKPELTMQEMLKVKDIPTVQRMQRSMDLVGEKEFERMVGDQFKKYKPTSPEQEAMLVESVTLDILGRANRDPELLKGLFFTKPQSKALKTAQKNAVKMLGLPENNTAMDRAKALGFEPGWAHGSPKSDITELKSSRIGAQGPGAYATNYLPEASTYSQLNPGATVYPLMVRKSEALITGHNNPYDELKVNADDALISELFGRGKSAIVTTQEKTPDWLLKAGAPDMPERQHFVSVKPSNFRSRFAAFDPARIDEPNLLAGVLPFSVLLDEKNRRELENRFGGLLAR